jgi:hypothetical protein
MGCVGIWIFKLYISVDSNELKHRANDMPEKKPFFVYFQSQTYTKAAGISRTPPPPLVLTGATLTKSWTLI